MQTFKAVELEEAAGKTRELLNFVQQRSKRIPNMMTLMANSPAALGAYLSFAGAFRDAALTPELLDLIGVAVAQTSGSAYTLAALCTMARNAGRSAEAITAARSAGSQDAKTSAALGFAVRIVERRGHVPASDVAALQAAGFSDGEVTEIIAAVVLNLYRSYFNLVADPDLDFPAAEALPT